MIVSIYDHDRRNAGSARFFVLAIVVRAPANLPLVWPLHIQSSLAYVRLLVAAFSQVCDCLWQCPLVFDCATQFRCRRNKFMVVATPDVNLSGTRIECRNSE